VLQPIYRPWVGRRQRQDLVVVILKQALQEAR
jgi:hypothetical protein